MNAEGPTPGIVSLTGGRESQARDGWLGRVDPALLRELAALAEDAQHRRRWGHVIDPPGTAAELAELLSRGQTPTVGWWRARIQIDRDPRFETVDVEVVARATMAAVIEGLPAADAAAGIETGLRYMLGVGEDALVDLTGVRAGLIAAERSGRPEPPGRIDVVAAA